MRKILGSILTSVAGMMNWSMLVWVNDLDWNRKSKRCVYPFIEICGSRSIQVRTNQFPWWH